MAENNLRLVGHLLESWLFEASQLPPHVLRNAVAIALAGAFNLALTGASGADATPCPQEAGAAVAAGWKSYRAGAFAPALALFQSADQSCPGNLDAKVGLGHVALKLGESTRADSLFRIVVAADSANGDGWTGLSYSAYRQSRLEDALRAARRSWSLHPGDPEVRDLLDKLLPGWEHATEVSRSHPESLVVAARTHGDRFEVPTSDGWKPFYVQGINLGVALPGRFPAEFPTDSLCYAGWLDSLSAMHANALRVYTILPPVFYHALGHWNAVHPERALWLVHGVWTELPPNDDFNDPEWKAEFRDEMRRVVDVIHGAAEFPTRPGHAGGRYGADLSRWTLAYLIGREWEPFAVKAFNAAGPDTAYHGRLLELAAGTATDAWMAEQCDFMLSDELDRYRTLRPIAYTNWPTLDPLHHPSEANNIEEMHWRRRFGAPAGYSKLEYENDAESLDPSLVRPTAANPGGWFASYHVYPYYPDFMILDSGYNRARSSYGRSNYFGYLVDLNRHHAGIPVLIAEYGVPSSRGIAHLQPQGWHHGGHDEAAMADIDARLTREIHESGMAGGILFAWIDEWFKKNWTVIDLELPPDRNRLWHNAMDPEQNYGVLGMIAGPPAGPRLGGDTSAWLGLPVVSSATTAKRGAPTGIRAGNDAAYVYLAVEFSGLQGRALPWDSLGVQVVFDTYRSDLGQKKLPRTLIRGEVGFEFLLDFKHPGDGALLVTPDYNPYVGPAAIERGDEGGQFYRRPVRSVSRSDGRFDSLFIVTNRARFARDGTFYPAQGYNRGRLRYGTEEESSLADWYFDPAAGLLEVRLPWGLLNFTDPSSRTLVFDQAKAGEFTTASSDGFRIGVLTYAKPGNPELIGALPALDRRGRWVARDFGTWSWATWDVPVYHERLKPAFHAVRDAWDDIHKEQKTWGTSPTKNAD